VPARPKRHKPRVSARPDPALRSRARKILTRLAKAHPDWGPTLLFSSPLELLVATILAAQAQDERINQVTRALFTKYRSPADYAAAPTGALERDIKAEENITGRVIDIVAPIGKGQRGLLVSSPFR